MNLYNMQDIKPLLARHGFHFSKSLGQNFLIASWVPEETVAAANLDERSGVLEIGPGIGALTRPLAQAAGKVVSVELDRTLLPVLRETLAGCANTRVIHGDILKTDLAVLVDEHFADLRPVVVANLPYNITTPVLTHLVDSGLFERITVMVQKEVALRITASAGSSHYGAFSVYAAYYTEPTFCFDVPPDCFVPRPKVDSAVITLAVRKTPPVSTDPVAIFQVIKAAFAQRRKTLVNCLCSAFPGASKEMLAGILIGLGHDSRIRGETLDLQAFAQLTDGLLDAGIIRR
ncbi:MAG: 16S rRNA (adenine(1518)-N(6)/adenine(1519)-N(6))-dimethyltransferase RsmA [Oscillospiraceae bacterium]|nr:16S rRNA (adenine(1518)-N(6)/adenine(1519)-N(6))-dimethyltransferase RsmA [Oscillospiraceae bacterium]